MRSRSFGQMNKVAATFLILAHLMLFLTSSSAASQRLHMHIFNQFTSTAKIISGSSKADDISKKMVSATGDYLNFNSDKTPWNKEDDFLTPLVVCGPSGVGKGTIISNYMSKFPYAKKFGFTTSHTTRSPRPGEMDGIDYHFTSHAKMEELIAAGKFLEHANVHGNIYGTSFEAIQHVENQLRKICLLDIDVQGVRSMKLHEREEGTPKLKGNYIFISPPSLETLKTRLMGRGTETFESLERRTKNAQMEMEYGLENGNFDYIIVNDDLEEACKNFDRIVKEIYGNIC